MAKILVVEDYDSQQIIYLTILTKAGHEVDVADDGEKALQMVKSKHYDLILLDMLLKHTSGMEFLKALDAKNNPSPPILVFSNLESPNIIDQALSLGATSYFTKVNYTPAEVLESVNNVLRDQEAKKSS